ncbi:hypothetical protein [Maridesulfovibrio sp.]|uniref:hypothetical protein n=1 Tax=Maridesulfovibrio sp. TaxID=2795000 RepID=UPI003BA86FCD
MPNSVDDPASKKILSQLCNNESCKACCIASALKALVKPLEHENLNGLAHIVDLLTNEATALASNIAGIPSKIQAVTHEQ